MPVKESDIEKLMNEKHSEPLDVARNYDAPQRPEKLYVKQQLKSNLDDVTPDEIDIELNTQFKTTFAKLRKDNTLSVNYDLFDREEHYENKGWEVITFVAQLELQNAEYPTGDL